jgi:PEP-CTERM motif
VLVGTGFWATTNAAYATRANQMLLALSLTKDPLPSNIWLQTQNTAGTHYAQDFMGPTPVPEPATALLLGVGLTAAAGFRSRRARKGDSV